MAGDSPAIELSMAELREVTAYAAACAKPALAIFEIELDAGGDRNAGDDYIEKARGLAGPVVVSVLTRSPHAPSGRGRVG
ncbi:hypothetical protein [Nocardia gipuzkoensis]|uniref:hypothetical protein n=1 Tax=Nocardia gipuzkoensis TaxID=2749991 RepID=UPI003EE181CA